MAKQEKPLADKIIAATGSAKDKKTLAEKLGVSYTYISAAVNALVAQGKLTKITNAPKSGSTGRPAATFKRAEA
jgi:predicted ArsR family transcriptional regulator